jgi:putative tryptophan/tyrosine transport system substrate-binding protein
MNMGADDTEGQDRLAAFTQALKQLGWSEGRNLRIDTRWATADDIRRHAAELAALAPDVLVAGSGTATVAPLLQATLAVPIVFALVIDPVGAGFVASLAQPGGNATGFTVYEYSMSGKWLELLKEIAPRVTRVAVLRDPAIASGIGQFGAVQIVAPSLGVGLSPVDVRDAGEIERAVAAFASGLNGGLIVTASPLAGVHRDLIATLAARHKLPAVYPLASTSQPVASSPTVPITSTNSGGRLAMSIASSRARSRVTFQCRRRPNTSWSSISKPLRRSLKRLPTRSSLASSPASTGRARPAVRDHGSA